jgi:hypothetical protein
MTESDFKRLLPNLKKRPHVVIIGAGASCATLINGDKYGKKISAMDNFIKKLGMEDIFSSVKLETTSKNLEDIYSELDERNDCDDVKNKLEVRIREYLKSIVIPDEPTIYDYLLLSLREKDLIISFNWDDLLFQARERVSEITKDLPQMVFLHGNIGVGYCKNDIEYGLITNKCTKCGEKYTPSQLLFPVKVKNYNSTFQLQNQWKVAKDYINRAGFITIFGYGAPNTDVEAKDILLKAFKCFGNDKRFFEEIQIIDKPGLNESEMYDKWSNFIHISDNHYKIISSFFNSILAEFPRRSIEGHLKRNYEDGGWWGNSKISLTNSPKTFNEIKELIQPLLDNENNNNFEII